MGGWGAGGPRDGLKGGAPDISAREQGWKATGISASSAAWPFRGCVAERKKLTGGVRLSAEAAGAGRWAGVRERGAERGAGCGPGDARARGSGACFAGCGPCGAMVSWAERARLVDDAREGGAGRAEADWAAGKEKGRVVLGLGYGSLFYFPFSFLFLLQTKFEFKSKFEFKPHSNKIMHQHECNKKFKPMINFN